MWFISELCFPITIQVTIPEFVILERISDAMVNYLIRHITLLVVGIPSKYLLWWEFQSYSMRIFSIFFVVWYSGFSLGMIHVYLLYWVEKQVIWSFLGNQNQYQVVWCVFSNLYSMIHNYPHAFLRVTVSSTHRVTDLVMVVSIVVVVWGKMADAVVLYALQFISEGPLNNVKAKHSIRESTGPMYSGLIVMTCWIKRRKICCMIPHFAVRNMDGHQQNSTEIFLYSR